MSKKATLRELKVRYIKTFIEEANGEDLDKVFKACAGVDHIPYAIPFTDNPLNDINKPIYQTTCGGNGECKDERANT